ncbi:MAG TPA: sigma-70 family RNA polymerase sigma factor [Verrucomicrobiae bacterium]|jgi:RNA polymerase sigma factor (sigma-70 family)
MNELLRRYVNDRSEAAFQELVRQHIDLVYSSALRQMNGDAATAQDVTQAVFTQLAHNAPRLTQHTSLSGWLFTSTRYLAAKTRRTEQRRRSREQEAYEMNQLLLSTNLDAVWQELRPILDDAMHDLSASDREAILMRYFERLPLLEIGARLRLKESAAHMRIERAIGRLRTALAKRGVTSTVTALTAVIGGRAVGAAPAELATCVCSKAFASAAASGGLTWGLLKFAGLLKGNAAVGAGAAILVAGIIVIPRLLTTETTLPEKADAPLKTETAANLPASADVEVPAEAGSARASAAISEVKTTVNGEPSFKGQPLSSWLKQLNDGQANHTYDLGPWSVTRTQEQEEAAEAIQSIGSRALPYLVNSLTNMDPASISGNAGGDGKPNNAQMLEENRWAAVLAFDALGSAAKPAVPVLAQALNNIGDWPKSKEGVTPQIGERDFQTISDVDWHLTKDLPIALASVQPQGWEALTQALSSTNRRTRHFAAWAIGTHHAVVPGTIDALMHAATNEADDFEIFALGEIHQRPEDVVPLLTNVLESKNNSLRMAAAFALGKFGTEAASATPLLSKMLNDQAADTPQSRRIPGSITLHDAVNYALGEITNGSVSGVPAQ